MNALGRVQVRVARLAVIGAMAASACAGGCRGHLPGGNVIEPQVLGTQTDHINRLQEENAELAKLIIYSHEFEINLQEDGSARAADEKSNSTFDYHAPIRPQGFRLTEAGLDHVRQIADVLRSFEFSDHPPSVVVERSETSKRWDTEHHYPVYQNEELDEARRMVVVGVLETLGVPDANEIVVIAPAFPMGLNAREASAAYQRAMWRNDSGRQAPGGLGSRN